MTRINRCWVPRPGAWSRKRAFEFPILHRARGSGEGFHDQHGDLNGVPSQFTGSGVLGAVVPGEGGFFARELEDDNPFRDLTFEGRDWRRVDVASQDHRGAAVLQYRRGGGVSVEQVPLRVGDSALN